jgi:hypothetical protein
LSYAVTEASWKKVFHAKGKAVHGSFFGPATKK